MSQRATASPADPATGGARSTGQGSDTTPERARTLLILGASGDLTGRLLLPGVARLLATRRVDGLHVVGAGSDDWSQQRWADRVSSVFDDETGDATGGDGTGGDGTGGADGRHRLDAAVRQTSYHHLDVTDEGALAELVRGLDGPVAVYFALPPAVAQRACEALSPGDLPEGTRLVLEKPFGSSAESAHELNQTLARLVPEDHIHRVDHFLGKSTVLNVLGLRFANLFLEPLWDNRHIARVEIVFDEPLGLEGRARYYDHAGALRDMLQSHLLQVLAVLAMEPPATLSERDIRDGKAAVLRATRTLDDLAATTRRARYTAGTVDGRELPDYAAEPGVDPDRGTETLAEVELAVQNWRWAGVPFVLRSGKAIGHSRKEALITFKAVPHLPTGFRGVEEPTRLRIGFGPDLLGLEIDVDGPGDLFTLNRVSLEAELAGDPLLPYGEVLDGVIQGDPLLSVRDDTAEDCWRIMTPVLQAFAEDRVPLQEYPAGSGGPADWTTSRS